MASITITNDPTALLNGEPGAITLISQTFQTGGKVNVQTLIQAEAIQEPGTLVYVAQTKRLYIVTEDGLEPIVVS